MRRNEEPESSQQEGRSTWSASNAAWTSSEALWSLKLQQHTHSAQGPRLSTLALGSANVVQINFLCWPIVTDILPQTFVLLLLKPSEVPKGEAVNVRPCFAQSFSP